MSRSHLLAVKSDRLVLTLQGRSNLHSRTIGILSSFVLGRCFSYRALFRVINYSTQECPHSLSHFLAQTLKTSELLSVAISCIIDKNHSSLRATCLLILNNMNSGLTARLVHQYLKLHGETQNGVLFFWLVGIIEKKSTIMKRLYHAFLMNRVQWHFAECYSNIVTFKIFMAASAKLTAFSQRPTDRNPDNGGSNHLRDDNLKYYHRQWYYWEATTQQYPNPISSRLK